ncbi:MAG: carboxypeptidase regulatory-like domain-containing protein, partial [Phycisphaerales bacterium]|nr:carboxypeptidase regulatory-like domain-containing protein [Phycisphaerales bacterium]
MKNVLVYCLTTSISTVAFADVTVSGVVRDYSDNSPVEGALVTLQATSTRTTTNQKGYYELTIPGDAGSIIVAASKGYFNTPTTFDGSPTGLNINIEPVPQYDNDYYSLLDPTSCGMCHPEQLSDWENSPMQKAGINTWVHDIYAGNGSPGGMGGFVYLRDSVWAESNPASECSSCHQPESWIPEPFTALEGPDDPGYPSAHATHGISCDVCHKVADVDVDKINHPGIYPGAVTFTRPYDDQVQYGLLGDATYHNPMMGPSYQPQLVAEVCGTCHQDKNDPHEDESFDGIISEPTYIEWVESPYGDPNSGMYATCLDCHMLPNDSTNACEVLYPPLEREPGTLRSHMILGSTATYLDNSAELLVGAEVVDGELQVEVDVFNNGVGHHLPTGVTVRNCILLVEAFDDDGNALDFTGDQVVHALGGVGDPAEGYYADEPGKLFAKCNHGEDGTGPTFYTDATGIIFDTRIPAMSIDSSDYSFALPAGGGDVTV